MAGNRKLIIILIGLFLFFQILAFVLTKSLRRDLSKFDEQALRRIRKPQTSAIVPVPKHLSAPKEKKVRHRLIPVDPRDYGCEVYSESTKPKTQEEWDILIRGALKVSELSLPEEKKKAMQTIKMSAQEYDKRMQELEERMGTFKEKLKKGPQDKEASDRLEKLQILKALSKTLKQDVIAK